MTRIDMDKASAIFAYWRGQGLRARAANTLCKINCESLEDLRGLTPEDVTSGGGAGPPTFNEIARLAGWPQVRTKQKRRISTIADVHQAIDEQRTTITIRRL